MTPQLWIIVIGTLVALSCGLLGCFLVLRRLSMIGDAISHAVLPGVVMAFLLTGSRSPLPVFIGAVALGLLTTVVIQALERGGVQGDAAIGVTFTSLFAIGVILISHYTEKVDLDLDCVLYGEIALAPYDLWMAGGRDMGPRAAWTSGILLLINLSFLLIFYKEWKICAFDPAMAAAAGIPVAAMHYLLMSLVSITTVGAFESVGAILVVAMLIVPGATAYLLTDRLDRMLLVAAVVGFLSALLGYLLSRRLDCSPAGAMAGVAGLLFMLAFLFSPSHGVVSRFVARRRLRKRVAEEDLLLWAVRREESGDAEGWSPRTVAQELEWLPAEAAAVTAGARAQGLIAAQGNLWILTGSGRSRGLELLRRHRLYESYLDELGYPTDHLHAASDRVEHHLSPALTEAIDVAADRPQIDPQGRAIPAPPAGVGSASREEEGAG